MAPTIEEKPVRYFYIQLNPSKIGQWGPEVKVQADTICEAQEKEDGNTYHIFKRGNVVVAQYQYNLVTGWRIVEEEEVVRREVA